jgi:hypothetical protein
LERIYSKILHLAEKCPDLGIDIMGVKKKLIECQSKERELEMKRKYLQDKKQEPSSKNPSQRPVPTQRSSSSPTHKRTSGVISQ